MSRDSESPRRDSRAIAVDCLRRRSLHKTWWGSARIAIDRQARAHASHTHGPPDISRVQPRSFAKP